MAQLSDYLCIWRAPPMGHYSSRPTIESSVAIDINRMLRSGVLRPGHHVGGVMALHPACDEGNGRVRFDADMRDPANAVVRLTYQADGRPAVCVIPLEAMPLRGGVRWWWRCPVSGRRAAKLFMFSGMFVHREAGHLAYQTWRDTPMRRSHRRQRKLCRKLGDDYTSFSCGFPTRPRGMHQRTYLALVGRLEDAIDLHLDLCATIDSRSFLSPTPQEP